MLKVAEFFGGIGACTKALKRIGFPFEVVDYVEINDYSVNSYNAINDTNFEPQDITKWDKDIDVDLIMHGSPCQDFSLVGKQAGGDEGSGTRSSLMFETVRIVEKLKPKYVVWENVKNVLSATHYHNFQQYLNKMESLGYTNHYKVLPANDYGIPQARERIFVVSILGNNNFVFPDKIPCPPLLDFLDDVVGSEYYFSDYFMNQVKNTKFRTDNHIQNTLDLVEGKFDEFLVMDYRYDEGLRIRKNKLCPTLTTRGKQSISCVPIFYINKKLRFITPREAWRLMGFDDSDYEKAEQINPASQLYKQAGNSIVVDVLVKLFTNLLMEEEEMKKVSEKKTVTIETDKMIDLVALQEKEPELFEELATDYPCEEATYVFEVKK